MYAHQVVPRSSGDGTGKTRNLLLRSYESKSTMLGINMAKVGRPLKFFEPEVESDHFYCQLASCRKWVGKEEENWVKYEEAIIRVCNETYKEFFN